MAEYNPSKIIKDGNTYNFRDTTKIPLAGSNAISGSLIPATTNAYDLGSDSYRFANVYASPRGGIHSHRMNNDFTIFSGGVAANDASTIWLYSELYSVTSLRGVFQINAKLGSTTKTLQGKPDGTLTWGNKNLAMQEDVVPRSGGAVITGTNIGRADNTGSLDICGGTSWTDGGYVALRGKNALGLEGVVIIGTNNGSSSCDLRLFPDGTLTWSGQPIQYTSDQRLKQQIAEIDDKLLDAWEDVDLVQFKYNDAVKEKSDNARLHTGYVVQQINEACKSHNVDISAYGLYCHEVYQEETREVEHEDGTKTIEVVRPASEHYSLRYTETLIVECAYLRKCIKELRNEIEELKSSK